MLNIYYACICIYTWRASPGRKFQIKTIGAKLSQKRQQNSASSSTWLSSPGYGSIPINSIFRGDEHPFTSINPSYDLGLGVPGTYPHLALGFPQAMAAMAAMAAGFGRPRRSRGGALLPAASPGSDRQDESLATHRTGDQGVDQRDQRGLHWENLGKYLVDDGWWWYERLWTNENMDEYGWRWDL